MKQFTHPRPVAAWLVVSALAFGTVPAVSAGTISLDTFSQFGFTNAGTPATGCDPDDPAGPFCLGSSGTPSVFLDAPPWLFLAPVGGVLLTVTDAFTAGDRFEIFDFGVSLGLTSAPVGSPDCGDDPAVCLATAGMSNSTFALAAGNHSITITPTLAPDGAGSGYLSASTVPEPSTWALCAGAMALLLWRSRRLRFKRAGLFAAAVIVSAAFVEWHGIRPVAAQGLFKFTGPMSSQPLALSADDGFLVVANPDNNSVSFFDVRLDRNRRLAEVPVQVEPNGVAMLPDGSKAYVANTVSGTVSVIPANIRNGVISKPSKHIPVGTEPYSIALTPNGRKLYVANSRSNTVSVIDTTTDAVIKTILNVGPEPRGIAITNNENTDDTDETVYVTQFLSLPVAGKVDGQDDAKAGHVTVISTATDLVTGQVRSIR